MRSVDPLFLSLDTFTVIILKGYSRVRRKLAVIMTASLALVACSPISSGTIIDKKNYEAYSYLVPYCMIYNAKGVCTAWGQMVQQVPEQWKFILSEGDREGWSYVTRETYDRYEIGDHYGS